MDNLKLAILLPTHRLNGYPLKLEGTSLRFVRFLEWERLDDRWSIRTYECSDTTSLELELFYCHSTLELINRREMYYFPLLLAQKNFDVLLHACNQHAKQLEHCPVEWEPGSLIAPKHDAGLVAA